MGLLNGFCSLMILLIINIVALPTNLNPVAAQVDVKTCANGTMTKQCGESIRLRVAMNVGPPPTKDCCAQLVKVGKPCHDAYVQERHLKVHDFVGSAEDLLKRSDQVWTQCVNSIHPPAAAPGHFD
ncbi:hypothetical protein CDL15_Pgr005002 [Punica granatum]|uniref:Prolamin-like domain-containing protein n=2 Tax=Punica granatum TaxID=22663 RepID=A0A218XRF7_PUNGR|nr:hypothetical protein CDL15_Pgr005002 [Punica granatum]